MTKKRPRTVAKKQLLAKPKQLSLLKSPRKNTKRWWIIEKTTYGGSMNYRKLPRPFDSKKLTHTVLKANVGPALWFTHRHQSIRKLLNTVAVRYNVKIRDLAINTDHIHILFYTKHKENQVRFLRLFSAEMGRVYKRIKQSYAYNKSSQDVEYQSVGARHAFSRSYRLGSDKKKINSLWVARPFTRLVVWGKTSVENVTRYIKKNREEAMGFIKYQPRLHRLNLFLTQWQSQPQPP